MKKPEGYRRSIIGRGAASNPKNRFERIEVEPEPEGSDAEESRPETVYLRDASRSLITRNDSPDIGFDASINPYRDAVTVASTASPALTTNISASLRGWISRAGSWSKKMPPSCCTGSCHLPTGYPK